LHQEEVIYSVEDYARAESFLPWQMETRVPGEVTEIAWLPGSPRYRFKLSTQEGWRYRIADASTGIEHQDAFDHEGLTAALAAATDEKVDPSRLGLTRIGYRGTDDLEFDFNDAGGAGTAASCGSSVRKISSGYFPRKAPRSLSTVITTCGSARWRQASSAG
jgi:hypothetical protein